MFEFTCTLASKKKEKVREGRKAIKGRDVWSRKGRIEKRREVEMVTLVPRTFYSRSKGYIKVNEYIKPLPLSYLGCRK